MENKVKVWLARDKDGELYVYSINRPIKILDCWFSSFSGYLGESKKFPSIKWGDDEPTEAYITLAEPQEQPKQEQPQPKQEIDWEQRRYEIVRDNLFHCPITDNIDEYKAYLTVAFKRAEMLINELKNKNK